MSAEALSPVTSTTSGIDAEQFRAIFRAHPAGVAVVTLHDGHRPVGFTATSVISVSAEPPLVAFSVSTGSSSWPALSASRQVVINFLADDQASLSARFAASGVDRFADGGWRPLPSGVPVLDGCSGWIEAAIHSRLPAADSRIVLVEAMAAWGTGRQPLVYRDRSYHKLIEYEI
ncbi:MAG TPA: flavin reductase family protein [Candidatus Avipropionibacterium avicola]|uniref:Flavin reductase family protein n=1 Tax=Candidatus Avipropionibacterium avicola TaxID=2840701 RepID=A0A9D1KMR2_9ACTN|nr:flavin reductase family protein [Candidatus Avipropionibacterium avicola]